MKAIQVNQYGDPEVLERKLLFIVDKSRNFRTEK